MEELSSFKAGGILYAIHPAFFASLAMAVPRRGNCRKKLGAF
jgi:hypothetical protein